MKTFLCTGILLSATSLDSAVLADDKVACLDASSQGQASRQAHELVEAREQFRLCARQQCPGLVQKDCADWLDDVEKNLPTVVLTAKNRAGADLVNVQVSVDGRPLVTALDGQAVSMNPGHHKFHFNAEDGSSADQEAVLREGEHNRAVVVVLEAPVVIVVEKTASHGPVDMGPKPRSEQPSPKRSTRKTVGLVSLGVGAAGLVLGGVTGGVAGAMHGSLIGSCPNGRCPAQDVPKVNSYDTMGLVSTVGFIAGGALAGLGVVLVVTAPKAPASAPRVGLTVAPTVGGGVLGAVGRF